MISWFQAVVLFVATIASLAPTTTTTTQLSSASSNSSQERTFGGGGGASTSTSSLVGAHSSSTGSSSTAQPTNIDRQSHLLEGAQIVEELALPTASSSAVSKQQVAAATGGNSIETPTISSMEFRRPIYTNQFVIQVKGGEVEAKKLAKKHGFVYLNHILGDYYHLEHRRLAKRSTSLTQDSLNISIQEEPEVLLLERQVLKRRVKRDFIDFNNNNHNQMQHFQAFDSRLASASGAVNQQLRAQQESHPASIVRAPNQQRPNGATQTLQQPQMLRPNSQRPIAHSAPHHQFTRPANQLPAQAEPRVGAIAQQRSGQLQQQQLLSGPARFQAPFQQEGPGRTQELLETAATSGSLLFQQASATAATPTAPAASSHKQRPQVNPHVDYQFNLSASSSNTHSSSSLLPAPLSANGTSSNRQQQPAPFNDPSWPLMWYLDGGAKNGFDLNVMAAWKMGYTGKGIVITILDDGLEKDHPDLQANYDPLASFDINGDDADPMPRYDVNDSNRHGTRCAGEVAAVPDNNICSIGIAYNSKVGGVRMLDGDVTDAVEARSLGLNNQHIHIYSASWGPDDNGKTVDGPGEMATRAFIEGVTNGRQGLGSIFVFASGNGGREHDNCNCDGYTNSIWTLSISSATENGNVPWYIEACSSTLATTYSSGDHKERQITTTDLHHSCTPNHTGTSASAPLAAGICALVLESNPRLTWRDMQHIVVRTAKPANLVAKDWRTNALGRNVSHAFGYGLMDAAGMITMAKRWTTVPVQYTCEVRSPTMEKFIPAKGYIELKLKAECSNVRYLEHVQSKVTLTSSRRGDLHIYLISPHGTRSTLLAQRPNDQAEQGFRNWPFMTVHNWGESPNGIWTLEVHNDGKPQSRAYLKEWTLILYGTYEDPNKHLDVHAGTYSPPVSTNSHIPLEPHHNHHHNTQQNHHHQPSNNNNNNNNNNIVVDKKPPGPLPNPAVVVPQSQLSIGGTPILKQPVSSPPPPLPALNNHHSPASGGAPSGEQALDSINSQVHGGTNLAINARPSTHQWSYSSSSPAPPLPAPVSGASGKPNTVMVTQQQQQHQQQQVSTLAPTTSTSTYLTTFKTIVTTSSSSSSSSLSSTPQPPLPGPITSHHQQENSAFGQPGIGGSRIQVSQHPAKADFEVVSPPPSNHETSMSPPTPDQSSASLRPTMVIQTSHNQNHQLEIVQPSNHLGGYNNGSSQQHSGDYHANHHHNHAAARPPINQINEAGRGDTTDSSMPMKPPVSQDTPPTVTSSNIVNNINNNNNNNNNNIGTSNNQEIDANQIDSKLLTKDYRSSGDQSGGSNDIMSSQSSDASGSKTLAKQQESSSTSSIVVASYYFVNCWPYLIMNMLILIHLTNPLVRSTIVH